MRKKIPSDNQKFYMKLRELVCRGSVTWRSKGKNYRIKTPSCPALRRINQVESELCVCVCVSFIPIIEIMCILIFNCCINVKMIFFVLSHRMARRYKTTIKSGCRNETGR